ncbi:MAG: hypothetical protein RR400_03995, partial [Clostridia bacterium]
TEFINEFGKIGLSKKVEEEKLSVAIDAISNMTKEEAEKEIFGKKELYQNLLGKAYDKIANYVSNKNG